jgi:hypothetical protein
MKSFFCVWLVSIQIWRSGSLKVHRLDSVDALSIFNQSRSAHHKISDQVANSSESNVTEHGNTTQNGFDSAASEQFFSCSNSSSCSVDSVKVETELHDVLILLFGCSLDVQAIGHFCQAATGVPMGTIVNSAPFGYLATCSVGGVTLAYSFHPGASAPPYYVLPGFDPTPLGTTKEILHRSHHDILVKFGREPSAIVVDASLWDIANWWGKIGRPPYPYNAELALPYMQQWCNSDVPALLTEVAKVYPNSAIAMRTAPTVLPPEGGIPDVTGRNPVLIDTMVNCLEHHRNPSGLVYGRFSLIDYHQFVDGTLQHAGAIASSYYADSLHPGAELSLIYVNNVFNWVKSLR